MDQNEMIQALLYGTSSEKNRAKAEYEDGLTEGQMHRLKLKLMVKELETALDVINWTRNHDHDNYGAYADIYASVKGALAGADRMYKGAESKK